MELLGCLFLISALVSTATSFDLVAHRTHDCLHGTAKFICFDVGYLYCCRRSIPGDFSRLQPFLSMSQTSTAGADILTVHLNSGPEPCAGRVVGSSIYGCANEEGTGLPRGGKVRNCVQRGCFKRSIMASEGECKGIHEADAVFYQGLYAYAAQPKDPRLIELITKIDMDDELTESELQELEPLRMPSADFQNTTSPEGSK